MPTPKEELAEKIREVLLGGYPKMDTEGKPFSGLADVIAQELWTDGYRDVWVLMAKLSEQSKRIKAEMTVADDYQRGCLHGINLSVGVIAQAELGVDDAD